MSKVHRGVLLPVEMHGAGEAEKDAYAEKVKIDNRAFVRAVFALEDRAAQLGVELDA